MTTSCSRLAKKSSRLFSEKSCSCGTSTFKTSSVMENDRTQSVIELRRFKAHSLTKRRLAESKCSVETSEFTPNISDQRWKTFCRLTRPCRENRPGHGLQSLDFSRERPQWVRGSGIDFWGDLCNALSSAFARAGKIAGLQCVLIE